MAPSGRRPKTKPDDLGCESACTGCQKLHPPSPFIITQPESWYSFYPPTEGRRLSRPSWLVTYRNGLPVHRRSPIWCNPALLSCVIITNKFSWVENGHQPVLLTLSDPRIVAKKGGSYDLGSLSGHPSHHPLLLHSFTPGWKRTSAKSNVAAFHFCIKTTERIYKIKRFWYVKTTYDVIFILMKA